MQFFFPDKRKEKILVTANTKVMNIFNFSQYNLLALHLKENIRK